MIMVQMCVLQGGVLGTASDHRFSKDPPSMGGVCWSRYTVICLIIACMQQTAHWLLAGLCCV